MNSGHDGVLSADGVRLWLPPDSLVRRVICLDTVDSTNTYAKGLAGDVNGTLVMADRQTAGRGRSGHSFESPPCTGLYMTLIIAASMEPELLQMITVAAADAVCLTLEELAPLRPLIKWVNDIFLRGADGRERKVCGILAEGLSGPDGGIERVVVGIGVNLTTRSFGADAGAAAGSVFEDGTANGVERERVAAGVAWRLMDFAGRLASQDGREYLLDVYRERSMLLGREISYIYNNEKKYGVAVGIDGRGGLVVEDAHGVRATLRSGEVHEVRPS